MPLQYIISFTTTFVSYNNYNKKIYAIAGMVAWLYAFFFFYKWSSFHFVPNQF